MTTENLSPRWKTWQKIIFRVLFLFLLFFTIDYLYFTFALAMGVKFNSGGEIERYLSILHKPLYWLDAHLYHTGYNLSLIHISEPTRQAENSYAVFCLK